MSQELPPLIPLLPVGEEYSWRSRFSQEGRVVFLLAKNTLPIAATRFVTYCSDIAVYTWVASRAGSDFLAEIVIPLSYIDASYWILSALFAMGINIVKARMGDNDSGVANYFYAGTALGITLPFAFTLPGFIPVARGLGLSDDAARFGYLLTGDVILRNIEMHWRQVMIGTEHHVIRILDGSHISLLTGMVKAGVFFGLASYFVPGKLFMGFLFTRVTASGLKILFDGLFLRDSGRVFLRPEWKNIFSDMKLILKNGWKISAQIFIELTVVGSLSIYVSLSKDKLKLIAFRLAGTLDGALAPWTSAWVRGLQRMLERGKRWQNIQLSKRACLVTTVSALIPVGMYVGFPKTFLSIFTEDAAILDVGENIVRMFSSGQFFYVLYAFMQSSLWVLFKDTRYSMEVSILAALLNFAVTLPLMLTGTGDFDAVMGAFIAYTAFGFSLLMAKYVSQMNRVAPEEIEDEPTDAENAGIFGLFRSACCTPREPRVEIIEHTRIPEERGVELKFD